MREAAMELCRWNGRALIFAIIAGIGVSGADMTAALAGDGESPLTVQKLQDRASHGDTAAALSLGVIYDTGQDGVPNPELAARWYQQAADRGSAIAAFDLAALYDGGRLGDRDAAEAVRWYRVSAERGFARAAFLLGVMIEAGDGTAKDATQAAVWYRRALAEGVPAAGGRLEALTQAAKPPSATAQRSFMTAVADWRVHGLDEDDPAAVSALRAAARDGLPLAEYDLAYFYEHGVAAESDIGLAYAWYKLAAGSNGPAGLKAAAAVNRDRLARRLSDEDRAAADRTSVTLTSWHP
jgi:TPR repeat protein